MEYILLLMSERDRCRKEAEYWKHIASQRGARMQIMYDYISTPSMDDGRQSVWQWLIEDHPDAVTWFDKDGIPTKSVTEPPKEE